jgi:UDP-glucose 4-epimerase
MSIARATLLNLLQLSNKMRTILVTGGAGFIGSHTVVELIAVGHRPVIIDNFSNSETAAIERLEKLTGQKITYYDMNYQDTARLDGIIKDEKIDGVVHFAAYKAVGKSVSNPLDYYENNVSGFVALLELIKVHHIKHFVFSSSAAVYGNPPVDCVDEETACNPTSPYGWSKYMDEIILKDACAAIPHLGGVSLRYFNVVGAHESKLIGELGKGKPENLLPIIVQVAAHQLPPFTVYGTDYSTSDGTCLRDYVHVVDLAKAHVAALKNLEASSGGYSVYNIGTGTPTSVLDLIHRFEVVNQLHVPYLLGERRPGDPAAYFASAEKAQRELQWHATKTIDDAVRDAWQWHESL